MMRWETTNTSWNMGNFDQIPGIFLFFFLTVMGFKYCNMLPGEVVEPPSLKVFDLTGHSLANQVSLDLFWAGVALNDFCKYVPDKIMILLQEAWVCFRLVHRLDCYTLDIFGNVFRVKLISWQSAAAESSVSCSAFVFFSLLFAVAGRCDRQFRPVWINRLLKSQPVLGPPATICI